ncbi:RagB/SusD family nutrient uptake outer membrane protein [Daejeonella sp. JGW-45]|uniref:RagB/SusD family nutrient uptake outer membrane protein n=1 Tax=Daejeonella sp. JGW-45 TaxID=3034148 RepID=UPI0023EB7917|nr:RagB/SusD family nutrient uptake outer membrane protein [Daejeonella sp. JGW-45]
MKKIIYAFAGMTMIAILAACSKEDINSEPVQYVQSDLIYGNSLNISQAVNRLYTYVPTGYNRLGGSSMVASATDEAVHGPRNSEAEFWGTGLWASSSPRDDSFSDSYAGIRATYVYSEEIHPKIIDAVMSKTNRDIQYGQVLFIRALLNFELLKRYGGYPIVKSLLKPDDNLNIAKSSYDECVQYITALCDEAITLLPPSYATADFGRATRGAAMALKARLLLYAASPLNNPSGAVAKWQAAAAASDAVIKLNLYSLYTAGTGYDAFFNTIVNNNEIIFLKHQTASNTFERLNGPVSLAGGEGGTNPSLDLVNAYERIDGTPFSWSNPTHAANPFANRDPRFAKSILFNGASWMGTTIETFDGGKDKQGAKATRTGFYLRKFLVASARWTAPTGTGFHSFPLFRYGEVLLNYAEAMNEAFGPDNAGTFGMTARQALTMVRTRAGLTGNQSVPLANDQAKMRIAIRNERRIELAFEEHRHLDLRRWKTAEQVLNQPVSGLKIVKNANGTFTYTPEVVEPRVFQAKMYLYPFPLSEIGRNSSLVQNTGW